MELILVAATVLHHGIHAQPTETVTELRFILSPPPPSRSWQRCLPHPGLAHACTRSEQSTHLARDGTISTVSARRRPPSIKPMPSFAQTGPPECGGRQHLLAKVRLRSGIPFSFWRCLSRCLSLRIILFLLLPLSSLFRLRLFYFPLFFFCPFALRHFFPSASQPWKIVV